MSNELQQGWKKGKCPSVYGPIQSRRFGKSLGINLGDPYQKQCTWNCVYCQCGFGSKNSKRSFLDPRKLQASLIVALNQESSIECITLAGNCEPTLHPQFSKIIQLLLLLRNKRNENWKIIVLTNGENISNLEIRYALNSIDETYVKVDCVDEALFRRLNIPNGLVRRVGDQLDLIRLLERPRVQGLFWKCPERPLFSNWEDGHLQDYETQMRNLNPDSIHITTIDRWTALPKLKAVPSIELEALAERLRRHGIEACAFPAGLKEPGG